MSRVASRAMLTSHTLDTSGTVRDARGFASSTYTTSSRIAYWMFMSPTTPNSTAIRRV